MKDLYTENNNLSVPSVDEWIKKLMCVYIHTQWNIIQPWERSLAIYDNMDGPWGYYAKWNKSEKDTKWSHLYLEPETKTS